MLLLLACAGPDTSITKTPVDADSDGYTTEADCDDTHATVHPDADEVCDGLDNDCDGRVDVEASDAPTWYQDQDGDTFGATPTAACEAPDGHVAVTGDCDDLDAGVHPTAPELCDGLDNDCDGAADEDPVDPSPWYRDDDGDGHGATETLACEAPEGHVTLGDDCDDADPSTYPGAPEPDCTDPVDHDCDGLTAYADDDGDGAAACEDCDDADPARAPALPEVCGGGDEDCDSLVDDDDPDVTDAAAWYRDLDADGWATGDGAPLLQCEAPVGYTAAVGDCDDEDSGAHPGATEVCDPFDVDEDCDGLVDDDDPSTDAGTWSAWYADRDGDTYGDPSRTVVQCAAPSGYVADATDCDDAAADVHPGATEVCDPSDVDEDCDGRVEDDDDAEGGSTWYRDGDGDGHGGSRATTACAAPSGYVAGGDDCDDTDPSVSPDGAEVCGGGDEDCDGLVDDDDDVSGAPSWYRDRDADGHGDGAAVAAACVSPAGYVADASDCDDTDADVSPSDPEVCGGSDEDCDGLVDEAGAAGESTWHLDEDGDGHGGANTLTSCAAPLGYTAEGDDCDDTDATVSPTGTEACGGADEDCDGLVDDQDDDPTGTYAWYADNDADRYGAGAAAWTCGAPAGHVATAGDCDDRDPDVSPAGRETCGGADEDCDGLVDDADPGVAGTSRWYADGDGDTWGDTSANVSRCISPAGYVAIDADCDDGRATVYPGAPEVCDDADNDCDGAIDTADSDLVDGTTAWEDGDGDGWGDPASPTLTCGEADGVSNADDCDDGDATVSPDAPERYGDAVDQDCDGALDDPAPACAGATVPGDYATLADALDAGETTICLGAGTHAGDHTLVADTTVQGAGQDLTVLTGNLDAGGFALDLSWLTVEGGVTGVGGGSDLYRVTATCGDTGRGVEVSVYAGEEATVDACDLSCPGGQGLYGRVTSDNTADATLWLTNNYVHDSFRGVDTDVGGSSTSRHPYVHAYHNLFHDNDHTGLEMWTYGASNVRGRYWLANNLFVGNDYGLYQYALVGSATTYAFTNLYWDNTDTHGAEAAASADDQYVDPLLDETFVPPVPGSGSPAHGAGSGMGVSTDYWGSARDTTAPTLGPVE